MHFTVSVGYVGTCSHCPMNLNKNGNGLYNRYHYEPQVTINIVTIIIVLAKTLQILPIRCAWEPE